MEQSIHPHSQVCAQRWSRHWFLLLFFYFFFVCVCACRKRFIIIKTGRCDELVIYKRLLFLIFAQKWRNTTVWWIYFHLDCVSSCLFFFFFVKHLCDLCWELLSRCLLPHVWPQLHLEQTSRSSCAKQAPSISSKPPQKKQKQNVKLPRVGEKITLVFVHFLLLFAAAVW